LDSLAVLRLRAKNGGINHSYFMRPGTNNAGRDCGDVIMDKEAMMRVEVLHDVVVSDNVGEGAEHYTCAYPLTTLMSDGTLVCVYRRGKEKHSYDGIWAVQKSADNGQTWSKPVTIFDKRHLEPLQSVMSGGICQAGDGSLVTVFVTIEATRKDFYVFSEEGFKQRSFCYTARSCDGGDTWSQPKLIEHAPPFRMGISSKPFVLPGGELFIPGEHKLSNGVIATCASYSTDHGRTFDPFKDIITDVNAELNYCDARFAVLPGGEIMAMLWTFRQDNEETVEVHRSISGDNGRTWSAPEAVGYLGQITTPLVLDSQTILAASNCRNAPEGIRLWLSRDGGNTWLDETPLQMWDPYRNRIIASPLALSTSDGTNEGVWQALEKFTFGTPDLLSLPDDTNLLSYYATISNIIHVRACRFKLDVDER